MVIKIPYLKQEFRNEIQKVEDIDKQCSYGCSLSLKNFVGYLNYKIFKLVKSYIGKNGKSYFTFTAIVGTLMCCIMELYRKVIGNYEDLKEFENGKLK